MDFITLIGLTAAILTTTAFLPQAVKTIKTRQTGDLSLSMYSFMVLGVLTWLAYGLLIKNLPIILANIVTVMLTGPIWFITLQNRA